MDFLLLLVSWWLVRMIEHWARWVGAGWLGVGDLGAEDLGAGVLGVGIVDACRRMYAPYTFWTCQASSCTGLCPSDGGTVFFYFIGIICKVAATRC